MSGSLLPDDPVARKGVPVITGVLDYFPDAIVAVAAVSKAGNDQHNPGQPLHWSKHKSCDHVDCIGRHLLQRGSLDTDGLRHSAKLAWRALALLQMEIEAERAGMSVRQYIESLEDAAPKKVAFPDSRPISEIQQAAWKNLPDAVKARLLTGS